MSHIEAAHVNFYLHLELVLLYGRDLVHQVEVGPRVLQVQSTRNGNTHVFVYSHAHICVFTCSAWYLDVFAEVADCFRSCVA